MQITTAEFASDVERYFKAAQKEPVKITKNGRPHTVLLSDKVYKLLTKGRIARRIEDLSDEDAEAIARAEVPAEYAYLDKLDGLES